MSSLSGASSAPKFRNLFEEFRSAKKENEEETSERNNSVVEEGLFTMSDKPEGDREIEKRDRMLSSKLSKLVVDDAFDKERYTSSSSSSSSSNPFFSSKPVFSERVSLASRQQMGSVRDASLPLFSSSAPGSHKVVRSPLSKNAPSSSKIQAGMARASWHFPPSSPSRSNQENDPSIFMNSKQEPVQSSSSYSSGLMVMTDVSPKNVLSSPRSPAVSSSSSSSSPKSMDIDKELNQASSSSSSASLPSQEKTERAAQRQVLGAGANTGPKHFKSVAFSPTNQFKSSEREPLSPKHLNSMLPGSFMSQSQPPILSSPARDSSLSATLSPVSAAPSHEEDSLVAIMEDMHMMSGTRIVRLDRAPSPAMSQTLGWNQFAETNPVKKKLFDERGDRRDDPLKAQKFGKVKQLRTLFKETQKQAKA